MDIGAFAPTNALRFNLWYNIFIKTAERFLYVPAAHAPYNGAKILIAYVFSLQCKEKRCFTPVSYTHLPLTLIPLAVSGGSRHV